MHEFSLMANLLSKIESIAHDNDNAKVVGVDIWLGALSHITPEHFEEHFIEGVRGTCAEGAKLTVEQSDDMNDPNAQDILLKSVDLAV